MDIDESTKDGKTEASSRRAFLKVATATGAGIALGAHVIPQAAHAAPFPGGPNFIERPQTIIAVALTAEYLSVVFQSTALANANAIGLTPAEVTTTQAVLAAEGLHLVAVRDLAARLLGPNAFAAPIPGQAQPYSGPFSFPPDTFTSRAGYARTALTLETGCTALYLTANRDFAALGRASLAKFMYEAGGSEAEHRVIARSVGGLIPLTDVAFERDLLPRVVDAVALLQSNGFLSPAPGNSYAFTEQQLATALSFAGLLAQTTPS